MTEREQLIAALEWTLPRVGRPRNRIVGQNEKHYDRYWEIAALLDRVKKQ